MDNFDHTIKKLIKSYQEKKVNFQKIINALANYIYLFPKYYSKDYEEEQGEFFFYIHLRMVKILKNYKISKVKFLTYFTAVLKNHYINFKKQKTSLNQRNTILDNVNINYEYFADESSHLHQIKYNLCNSHEQVEHIISILSDKEKKIFLLYHFDYLCKNSIVIFEKYFKTSRISLENLFNIIRGDTTQKTDTKQRLRIRKIYYSEQIFKLLHKLKKCNDLAKEVQIKKKIDYYKNKRENIIKRLENIKIAPSSATIARILNIPRGSVDSSIYYIKQKIQRQLNGNKIQMQL